MSYKDLKSQTVRWNNFVLYILGLLYSTDQTFIKNILKHTTIVKNIQTQNGDRLSALTSALITPKTYGHGATNPTNIGMNQS